MESAGRFKCPADFTKISGAHSKRPEIQPQDLSKNQKA